MGFFSQKDSCHQKISSIPWENLCNTATQPLLDQFLGGSKSFSKMVPSVLYSLVCLRRGRVIQALHSPFIAYSPVELSTVSISPLHDASPSQGRRKRCLSLASSILPFFLAALPVWLQKGWTPTAAHSNQASVTRHSSYWVPTRSFLTSSHSPTAPAVSGGSKFTSQERWGLFSFSLSPMTWTSPDLGQLSN